MKKSQGVVTLCISLVLVFAVSIISYTVYGWESAPINQSKKWKMNHITPETPLVTALAGALATPDAVYNFMDNKYISQEEAVDVWKYPDDMIKQYNSTGEMKDDCEEAAFLEVSLLRAIGFSENTVRVAIITWAFGPHMGVEVWQDTSWLFVREDGKLSPLDSSEHLMSAFNDKIWWL